MTAALKNTHNSQVDNAPVAEISTFGAVCSGCNSPYKTTRWQQPWQCPDCARGGRHWLAGLAWGIST